MTLKEFEVVARGPYVEAAGLEGVGPYERVEAKARYAVDPTLPANLGIVDLGLAPRDADGLVHFSGDVSLLLPHSAPGAATVTNRSLLVDVPNRGNRMALRGFDQAEMDLEPTDRINPGDGFLLRQGWALAWCAWQWDVPRGPGRLGFDPPLVPIEALGPRPGRMQLRFQLHAPAEAVPLTDQHVGLIGAHRPIPPADPGGGGAELWVRAHPDDEPTLISPALWCFGRPDPGTADGGPAGSAGPARAGGRERVLPDDQHVWLEGGFQPGRVYDLVYQPSRCPVVGCGLLAVRDLTAWLRYSTDSPAAGRVDHVIGTGQSQCGRFLRTFLGLGLNADEEGRPVFDGVLAHIAGGRRGEFNHRWAQPSVQPTPGFGHLPPFSDEAHPQAGHPTGLLDAQRRVGGMPRIVYTDTAAEYWRGDAALTHTSLTHGADLTGLTDLTGQTGADLTRGADLTGLTDLTEASGTRRYLFASSQHGAGFPVLAATSLFGSRGGNAFNIVDYRPLSRAALHNLWRWVAEGVEPPPSRVPRVADGTAVRREEVLAELAAVPGMALPEAAGLPRIRPLDLGPDAALGVGSPPARPAGEPFVALVSAVDHDGNERAGVRMPDVTVPVATHTGFDPRHPDSGGPGQLLDYLGSTVPFAATEDERLARRDPRPSVAARYADRADYLEQVRAAARALVADRLLLADDIELCVDLAAARYDLVCRKR